MAEIRGFFGAISNCLPVLETVIQRVSPARRQNLSRVYLGANGLPIFRSGEREPGEIGSAAIFADCSAALPRHESRSLDEALQPAVPLAWVAGNLAGAGHDVPAGSPAQIARAAYERGEAGCFARLDGNFCVAIYDPKLRGFRVASDLAGTRPLFYAIATSTTNIQTIIFGSSAMEVLRASALPTVANARALQRYMTRGVLAGYSDTLLQGVRALRRNHYLEIVPSAPMRIRQLLFPYDHDMRANEATLHERAEELRGLLLSTVSAQSGSKNVAVALSGGIDSSGIVACLRHLRGPKEPLNAFFYLQRDPALPPALNERPWAERVAAHLSVKLNSVELSSAELPEMLTSVISAQDFPFSNPVILAQAKLFRIAAESGTEIMLSGHGPDLLFGGGTSHIALRLATLIRGGRLFAAAKMLRGSTVDPLAGAPRLLAAAVLQATRIAVPPAWRARRVPWASHAWFHARVAPEPGETAEASSTHLEPMQALIHEQLTHSLGSTSLLYENGNAASLGLDNRLPYLVAAMVHLARSCRPDFLVSDRGQTKHVLRLAMRGMLPDEILQRRDRIGFAVPTLPWLLQQRQWVEDRYLELGSLPFFRGVALGVLWQQLEVPTPSAWSTAHLLWKWIVLLEWARIHKVRFE
jgi:asparagine synthase (glutamine-hydrolysing)